MMANINQEIAQIQKEVSDVFSYTDNLLKKFSTAHSDMSAAMRADLKANLNERVEYTKNLLLQFNNKLAQMSQENQDMAKALRLDLQNSREALSQSDLQRLNNFNVVFTGIQNRVQEIQKYVNNFIDEFSTDRKQAAATWEKLAEAIANIGKASVAIDTEPIVDEPAGVSIAITTEPIVDEPAGEVAAEDAPAAIEPQKELTLEEKVLNYLSGHKSGIKISDMEAPLGETRMRIGFITKKLLEEGKVQKVENLYYPLA
jgi:predicted  nucleic acid-binding Zn-ribbon protein